MRRKWVLRFLVPPLVKFTSTLPQANQCLVAEVQSPLQPRTDKTYKLKPGPVCFFQQAKFPWFFFCISLTRHFVACLLNHLTGPLFFSFFLFFSLFFLFLSFFFLFSLTSLRSIKYKYNRI